MAYIPLACSNPLSFPLGLSFFEPDCCLRSQVDKHVHGILASKQIQPRFFDAIFLPAKITRFWGPEGSFSNPKPSVSWSVMSAKTLRTKIFLVSAPETLFRRAETTFWVVSARLFFSACGPKNLLYTTTIKRLVSYIIGPHAKI